MKTLLLSILLIITSVNTFSMELEPFLNPGIYLGYEFGSSNHGPVVGCELSAGITAEGLIAGAVYQRQYNFFSGNHRNIFEGEIGTILGGISIGKEFNTVGDNSMRYTLWGGIGLYGEIHYSPNADNFIGTGAMAKFPSLVMLGFNSSYSMH